MIRLLNKSELHIVRDLAQAIWPLVYSQMISQEQMEYMLKWMYSVDVLQEKFDTGDRFYCYEIDGIPIAYLHLEFVNKDVIKVQKIYVHPHYHGKGIGRELIEHTVRTAHEEQINKLELQVNRSNPAVDFYKRLGFTVAEEKDFDIGNGYFMNDYIMSMTWD